MNWLKEQRKKYGLTQKELAEKINCASNHYSLVERGKRPMALKFAKKIAYYYGVDVYEVMRQTDDKRNL